MTNRTVSSKDQLLHLLEDRERKHDAFRLAETAVDERRAESYSAEMSAFDVAHGQVLDWLNDTDHLSDLLSLVRKLSNETCASPRIYTHVKTGNQYEVLFDATETTNGSREGRGVVVYRRIGQTAVYVREASEFHEKFVSSGELQQETPVSTRRCHCGQFALQPGIALITDDHGHDHVFDGTSCDCEDGGCELAPKAAGPPCIWRAGCVSPEWCIANGICAGPIGVSPTTVVGSLDDPPKARCSICGRKTWDFAVGKPCNMPQPSGERCQGTFEAL